MEKYNGAYFVLYMNFFFFLRTQDLVLRRLMFAHVVTEGGGSGFIQK